MSSFCLGSDKSVTFYKRVKVFYFNKVPLEIDVDWQQAARDRLRFKRRLLEVERKIGWVFQSDHRARTYNCRYL